MAKDYYNILGVNKDASADEIKKAYRKLAHQHHPDRGGDESKFKEANEAYQTLSNTEKRSQYDQLGSTFNNASGGFDPRGFGGGQGGFNINFEDIFEQFFAGGARTKTRTRSDVRGRNVEIAIDITLEQAYLGETRDISLDTHITCDRCEGKQHEPGSKMKTCPTCEGSGQVSHTQNTFLGSFSNVSICPECRGARNIPEKKCRKCSGEGRVRGKRDVHVNIPPGIHSGDAIKIPTAGEAPPVSSGQAGDLFVRVRVIPHKIFTRKEDDLYSKVTISYSTATLGDSIKVQIIDGEVSLKILRGTSNGELIRLRGKGMPHVHRAGRGDHYVTIAIETPRKLSKKAQELLEELKKEGL